MSDDLAFLSASGLVAGYASGAFTPVEATRAVLAQAARLEPVLNAFCLIDADAALEAARASAARWQAGAPAGPLDGVPVSVKDIILTRGWPTLRGSLTVPADQPWDEDGPAVARLREGGAVLFGKTTTPEFAHKGVTDSPLTGITRNPWDPALTPGGSSGGASAAVAAGVGPLALATDAGGSVRIPAALTGTFGFKPSGGRVAMYPPTPYATLAAFGPIARTVGDAARMMAGIARPDPRDPDSGHLPVPDFAGDLDADLTGWRIAWSPTLGYARIAPEVAALTAQAALAFADMGATVVEVPHVMDDPWPVLERLKRGLTAFAFRAADDAALARMDPVLADEIREARGADLAEHLAAQMDRAALARRMADFHAGFDLLLTPAAAVPAFDATRNAPEGHAGRSWYPTTYPFNLTRQPAASVPAGFTAAGLPVGLQIAGPINADLKVLQAARAFERARPWADRWPALARAGGHDG
jgi:aspartyl-tRNA(Asn)/glutamyl-tRNA(Gln) amidotransferase subunit A